jgi:putative endonuclease
LTSSTKTTGDRGEDSAVQFLQAHGFEILHRNWRYSRLGELDIVARTNGVLIFCEVKRSVFDGESHPELRVDHRKQSKLAQLAQVYLCQNPCFFESIRFDIIAVKNHHGREVIEHIENAFWPLDGWDR